METSLRLEENIGGMISNLPGDVAMEAESLTPEGDVLGTQQERGQHLVAVIFLSVRLRPQGERMDPIVRRIFYFLFCKNELQKKYDTQNTNSPPDKPRDLPL